MRSSTRWMSFSLTKAVKSTHRHPVNKILHLIGLSLYAIALFALASYLLGNQDQDLMVSLALWLTAINLFITGHTIENNVRAMTALVLFKYVRSLLCENGFNISKITNSM
jgi:predicted membrane channel-forming protein YqfA (hemolysin III family)